MCGIIGVAIRDNPTQVKQRLYHIYVSQAHRGSDGAGVTVLREGVIHRRRLENPLELFDNKLVLKNKDLVLFHHRFPTSTTNEPKYNHPFNNEDNSLSLIHNGHISNYERLHKSLKNAGHIFESENDDIGYGSQIGYSSYGYNKPSKITDSEVIVHLIEGRKPHKAIRIMNSSLVGQYALAWVYEDREKIYLYKKDNPIVCYEDTDGNKYFSSEIPDNPFLEREMTNKVSLDEGVLYTLDQEELKKVASLKIKRRKVKRNKSILPEDAGTWVVTDDGLWENVDDRKLDEMERWEKEWEESQKNTLLTDYTQ
jgi:glucosamine--fructose-6-phosphate aminotransferase (isomerizing)